MSLGCLFPFSHSSAYEMLSFRKDKREIEKYIGKNMLKSGIRSL